mgnify:CR=1 FL=1
MNDRVRELVTEIRDLAAWHCDETADPNDLSPGDAVAHVNGLIVQICQEILTYSDEPKDFGANS